MRPQIQKMLSRLVFGAAFFLFFEIAAILAVGLTDTARPSDVAIVLGSKVNPDGTLSPRLQARLDSALLLYRQKFAPFIIVSGGFGQEGHDEALVMQDYLRRNGVPETAIIADQHGDNTEATAHNGAALMQQRGWKSAIVVTQYFHIARSAWALRNAGVASVTTAHARYHEVRDLYATAREAVACVPYVLRWLVS